jgi:hypothetical protein
LDAKPAVHNERPEESGTDAGVLWALQQQAGNAAVSALLAHANDGKLASVGGKGAPEEGFLAGHAMTVGVQRGPLDREIAGKGDSRKSQPVSIKTVNGPKDLGRGGYDWKVWLNLDSPAAEAGWVIQEVVASFKTVGSIDRSYHFWEAWEVDKGKTGTVWQEKGLDDNDDQYYAAPAAANSKGANKLLGKAKFYEGALPADFKKNNPSTIAGILHSTTSKPAFWDDAGLRHDIEATWDDTGGKGESNVVAWAGGTKLVGAK